MSEGNEKRAEPHSAMLPARVDVPREVKEHLDGIVSSSLKDIFSPEEIEKAVQALSPQLVAEVVEITSITATRHQGPMPTVEVAKGYEELFPGSIERMFKMAETDQAAYIDSNKDTTRRDDRFRMVALFTGLFALVLMMIAIIILSIKNHDWVAGSVAGIGISGIIGAFINARYPLNLKARGGQEPSD